MYDTVIETMIYKSLIETNEGIYEQKRSQIFGRS